MVSSLKVSPEDSELRSKNVRKLLHVIHLLTNQFANITTTYYIVAYISMLLGEKSLISVVCGTMRRL